MSPPPLLSSTKIPPGQILSELHEFEAMWTTQITQKRKRWHDGRLKFYTFNRRAVLYDIQGNFVADYFHNRNVNEGDELVFDRVLVTVNSKRDIIVRDIAPALIGMRNEARGGGRLNRDSNPVSGSNYGSSPKSGTAIYPITGSSVPSSTSLNNASSNSGSSNVNKPHLIGRSRTISVDDFATEPNSTSGIMITNDTFGSNSPITHRPNLINFINQENNPFPNTNGGPLSNEGTSPVLTPLKAGPSLGLKRRRIIDPSPITKPPTSEVRISRVTVKYENGRGRMSYQKSTNDTRDATSSALQPSKPITSSLAIATNSNLNGSNTTAAAESNYGKPLTSVQMSLPPNASKLVNHSMSGLAVSPTAATISTTFSSHTKRRSRPLISLQAKSKNSPYPVSSSTSPSVAQLGHSINHLRYCSDQQSDTPPPNIPPELQYQLSQDIDKIKEMSVYSDQELDSDDERLLNEELENLLSRSSKSSAKTKTVNRTSIGVNSDSAPVSTDSTAPTTAHSVSIEENGPWTKEALELFAWRPPGLS